MMAIGYARLEFVKRSNGKNACCKAAYNSRSKINFTGHEFNPERIYNWSYKQKCAYHDVLLPDHVDPSFKSPEVLWNAVEAKEIRKNSQLCMECVLALPDDKIVSIEDKKELARAFIKTHFVDKGLAAQIDIHPPDKKTQLTPELSNIENLDHNWHAHVLITTRRFTEDGKELGEKARDLMPEVRSGDVIDAEKWGQLWTDHQNEFFEQKGIPLRVDPNGIVVQIHLGPIRMRGRAYDLIHENNQRIELNSEEVKDPSKILKSIADYKNIFSKEDVENLIEKYVDGPTQQEVIKAFWRQKEIIPLLDANGKTDKYTTKEILAEEQRCIRLADTIQSKKAYETDTNFGQFSSNLSSEQKAAYYGIINGQRLSCIGGHAGTGKSHLLVALKQTYEAEKYTVRAFGPDTATTKVLEEKGFAKAENLHRFLFSLHNKKREIQQGREVWIIDEASKLGNRPIIQLLNAAQENNVQVVFSGDQSQMRAVDRGCMYSVLCERYGSQDLLEIKRQKSEIDRNISKQIANGKISQAVDEMIRAGGIVWKETRKECIEQLIKCWAANREAFPDKTSVIIAHSNVERKTLNEMVRLYRKEKKEISEKEYECQIGNKKIYVSTGDIIEFRKNDKVLGVSNGTQGILVEASPEKFVVAVKEEEKIRHVSFDPTQHTSYQLGYATTYHRSQGRTVDRAYVLQSPRMNRESFYVGLTRHVRKAYLFVPKDNLHYLSYLKAKACGYDEKYTTYLRENHHFKNKKQEEYITDLKGQVTQSDPKETTQDYLTARESRISELKNSNSFIANLKGHALSAFDAVSDLVTRHSYAKKADREFFNPIIQQEEKAIITETKHQIDNLEQEEAIDKTVVLTAIDVGNLFAKQEDSSRKESKLKAQTWQNLSKENKDLLKSYYDNREKAANLAAITKAETDNQPEKIESSPHFGEWMEACLERNESAYQVCRTIPKETLTKILGPDSFDILCKRSLKHEASLQRDGDKKVDLDTKLKENIEDLLYKLFPEGPTRRDSNGFRFGAKGSLSVKCRGENIGSFYDHENQQGGGPIGLIQKTLGLTSSEARKWAFEYLGQSKQSLPSHFAFSKKIESSPEWISCKPDPKHPAPPLKEINKTLDKRYTEVARHPYYDEKGDLLFYVLRLIDKQEPSKKSILPLSYGHAIGDDRHIWSLKGYQVDKKPLYNLPHLKELSATVLIVEGEKTADAATKLFSSDNIVCISWSNGVSAVSKTDWTPLFGRQVIIWPDNDEPGYEASEKISSELRKIGVQSLQIVDKEVLNKSFPKKWDLADPIPLDKSNEFIRDLLLSAKEKSIGLEQLILGLKEEKETLIDKLRANEVLWRVEERMRPHLEEKHGQKIWEIKNEIQQEMLKVLQSQDKIEEQLKDQLGLSGEVGQRLAYQAMLYQAETGKLPSLSSIEEMKKALGNFGSILNSSHRHHQSDVNLNKKVHEYAVDRVFSSIFCSGVYGKDAYRKIEVTVEKHSRSISNEVSKLIEKNRAHEELIDKHLGKQISIDHIL